MQTGDRACLLGTQINSMNGNWNGNWKVVCGELWPIVETVVLLQIYFGNRFRVAFSRLYRSIATLVKPT